MLIFATEIFLSSKYVIIIIVLTLNLKEQMKKINLFLCVPTALLMVASIFLFTSCEADDEGQALPKTSDRWVKISPHSLEFPAEGGTETVTIESSWNKRHDLRGERDIVKTDYTTLDANCKEWTVTVPPNYTDKPRELELVAYSYPDAIIYGDTDFVTDTIIIHQAAGSIAKLADLKISDVECSIWHEHSTWRYDDASLSTEPLPYTENIRARPWIVEGAKKNFTTKVVDNKYLVDIDIESPIGSYDPEDNIPRFGANYLSQMKLSLTIGLYSPEVGDDKLIIEKGTLYFNEEGEGTYTNPVNGVSGAAEYITHIELDLENHLGDCGPGDLLDRGPKAKGVPMLYFQYPEEGEIRVFKTPFCSGKGKKKFYSMPNGTEVKPATATTDFTQILEDGETFSLSNNEGWRFKITLIYK